VDAFIEDCESQFSQANNGKGVNAREKINFVRNALEQNGTRKRSFELTLKELTRKREVETNPSESYTILLADMKSVIKETPVQLKLRKNVEYNSLEMGSRTHVDFHIRFRQILLDLKDAGLVQKAPADLYIDYLGKLSADLRKECLQRRFDFPSPEGTGTVNRKAETWEECKQVCDDLTTERRNIGALKGNQSHGGQSYTATEWEAWTVKESLKTERASKRARRVEGFSGRDLGCAHPAGPSEGVGSRCTTCKRGGHSQTICPVAIVRKSGEIEYWEAESNRTGKTCSICRQIGVKADDHRDQHHEQAVREYAQKSHKATDNDVNALKGKGKGKKGKGRDDGGKGGGGKGGQGGGKGEDPDTMTDSRGRRACFSKRDTGTCSKGKDCEYSHDEEFLKRNKAAREARKGGGGKKGGGKGGKKGGGRKGGGFTPNQKGGNEHYVVGEIDALASYWSPELDLVGAQAVGSYCANLQRDCAKQGLRPKFVAITGLDQIDKSEFVKTNPRVGGYTAQTRVKVGGEVVTLMFDTGASCIGVREEEVAEFLNCAQAKVAEGEMSLTGLEYPIKRIEILSRPEGMTGLANVSPLQVKYCVALRIEFPPVNQERGPIKDFVVKVFPKGMSTFPGIILGMPACDVVPYGLGLRINATTYSLDGLGGLQLPRLDLSRRDAMHNAMRVYSACDDDAPTADRSGSNHGPAARKTGGRRRGAAGRSTNSCSCLWEINLAGPGVMTKALLGVHEIAEAEKAFGLQACSATSVREPPRPSSTQSGTDGLSVGSDDSSWGSLCGFDGPPLLECIADNKDSVLLAPGDAAEIPCVYVYNVARAEVGETLEVRRSPLSPVDVMRGVLSPGDKLRCLSCSIRRRTTFG
jgi:hypothetical protein